MLFTDTLYYIADVILICWTCLLNNQWILNFAKCFFSHWDDYIFLYSVNVVNCTDGFQMLKQLCIPALDPSWTPCIIFFYTLLNLICWCFVLAFMLIKDICSAKKKKRKKSNNEQMNLIVSQIGGLYFPRGISQSLLCTVLIRTNFSYMV